ncbi:DUF445 family protein [Brevibacillus sp. SYP-B805]|uniref:DUF445 domain-containing protein n=1 Tax=Brevibacillus sp. SYP-B805 TaxID=1578199 RepID=UPI0013ECFCE7|nr:DUF445 family protein [Brevibacillus sp. SYP-B805]NGQ94878.1 DUF445 family protein [Brevibacillus sp. SYP-B805]
MSPWLLVIFNIAIGSVIGGVTNELAIRMLFRPYHPWKIGRFRVPFTPGLIPRRRDEIGVQMGRLVEHYLLTPAGIKKAVAHADLEAGLQEWLVGTLDRWLDHEQTLREHLQRWFPALFDQDGRWSELVRGPVRKQWQGWFEELLRQQGERPLHSLLSPEARERLDEALQALGKLVLERFADYLRSENGQKDVQRMIRALLGGGGGMFGGLVGMFLGDEKVVGRLLPYVEEALTSPQLAERLSALLQQKADKLLAKRVADVAAWIGEEQLAAWADNLFARLEEKSLAWLDQPASRWFGRFRQPVAEKLIPRLANWAIGLLEENVERLLAKLSITEIVRRQVEGFPLERVEEMILGVTGKEFRMITILGFLLGGLIGLIQGVFYLLW